MYDKGKVTAGIVIFLVVVLFPIWFSAAAGKTGYVPEPEVLESARQKGECILPREQMRAEHMDVLDTWRDEYVREGKTQVPGRKMPKSLTRSCLDCHSNYEEFCRKCHDYVGVTPYCWDCHDNTWGDK